MENVFKKSKYLLSQEPRKKAYGIADFPGFDFNGYFWILINNVVIYQVSDEQKEYLSMLVFSLIQKNLPKYFGE